MVRKTEAHSLNTGDRFGFVEAGPIYTVDDGYFIDYWGARLIMYQAENGLHGHLADHTEVWLVL